VSSAARPAPASARPPDREQIFEWVERVATFFRDEYGLPPITGRILGWLLACEPAEQSGAQIADAIGASRASITTNIRVLTAGGLVRRHTRRGERTAYYVIDDDAWERLVNRRFEAAATFERVTRDGIELLGGATRRAGRVRAAHDVFAWFIALARDAPPVSRTEDGGW
jgi:DNA-binding transcriptional regulator GbsR (MarR family)